MINQVHLIGRTGAEPEVRHLENGTAVGRISLATSESWKDKDGNWQQTTDWHNVVVWRDLAERCAKFPKGALLYVTGKITYRKYTDKEGHERTATDIVASQVRRLEKSDPGKEFQEAETAHYGAMPAATAPKKTVPVNPPAQEDDLPF